VRSDFNVVENPWQRAHAPPKAGRQSDFDATILAAAGLSRLQFQIDTVGKLGGRDVPAGLLATILETRKCCPALDRVPLALKFVRTILESNKSALCLTITIRFQCVTAERAFSGQWAVGCQTPIGACATAFQEKLRLGVSPTSMTSPASRRAGRIATA